MGDKIDMFVGLGWEKEIRNLEDPHVLFTPSPEHDKGVENQCSDDYELTPFLQSTQTWRWRMQEEQKQYIKNEKKQADVPEMDADLDADKSIKMEEVLKMVGVYSKPLSFHKRVTGLSPHRHTLKDRMRDKTVSYIDLLQPGPPPSESSKKFAKWK